MKKRVESAEFKLIVSGTHRDGSMVEGFSYRLDAARANAFSTNPDRQAIIDFAGDFQTISSALVVTVETVVSTRRRSKSLFKKTPAAAVTASTV
jgi:hypothetical protein